MVDVEVTRMAPWHVCWPMGAAFKPYWSKFFFYHQINKNFDQIGGDGSQGRPEGSPNHHQKPHPVGAYSTFQRTRVRVWPCACMRAERGCQARVRMDAAQREMGGMCLG